MSEILRVYDPAECDERGVPLDWERCQLCYDSDESSCGRCGGHGSLKAAALAHLVHRQRLAGLGTHQQAGAFPVRCEGCGHPRSEGTWSEADHSQAVMAHAIALATSALRDGDEPPPSPHGLVHYSPCDEVCRHGGPGRVLSPGGTYDATVTNASGEAARHGFEASWRPVDVRCLGWAHDLRPGKLAVLCLRCFATCAASSLTAVLAALSHHVDG